MNTCEIGMKDPKTKETVFVTQHEYDAIVKFSDNHLELSPKQVNNLINADNLMQRLMGERIRLAQKARQDAINITHQPRIEADEWTEKEYKPTEESISHRASWDEYFMSIAEQVATRTTCIRRAVGAVAVDKRHHVLGTGYNGAPSGLSHCTKETCIRIQRNIPSGQQSELCKAIHAEQNLIIDAAGKLNGATVYCTTRPCTTCTKLLIGCGVDEIIWKYDYPDEYATTLLAEYQIRSPFDKTPVITKDKYNFYHFKRNP